MRTVSVLLLVVLVVGCGKQEGTPTGATPAPTQPNASVVKSWKPHTSNTFLFKASFPLGDPTTRPVFFGNQPQAVADGADLSVPVYTKETGQETYVFGIRTARFRGTPKTAERDETLDILLKGLVPQGWTKSEPKTITWAGRQATETIWSDPAKPTKIIIRQLVSEAGVYIGYIRDLGSLSPTEMARFFDEFQLLGK